MPTVQYWGKKGDGKTHHAVKQEVIPAVRAGRRVYTNVAGVDERRRAIAQVAGVAPDQVRLSVWQNSEEIRAALTLDKDDKDGKSLKIERGALVIIDEAQQVWRAREFKDTKSEFLNLLELERHFGLDFVFITQNAKSMDVAISRLTNDFFQVKNLRFLGAFGKSRYVVHYRQELFGDIVSTSQFKYDPAVFACYRSQVQMGRDHTGGRFSSPLRGIGLLIVACLGFGFRGLIFGGKKHDVAFRASNSAGGVVGQKGVGAVGVRPGLGGLAVKTAPASWVVPASEDLRDSPISAASGYDSFYEAGAKPGELKEIQRFYKWVPCKSRMHFKGMGDEIDVVKPSRCKKYLDDPDWPVGFVENPPGV